MDRLNTQDNVTLLITSIEGPSCFDPADQYEGPVRAYRVVSVKANPPVLELVPLGPAILKAKLNDIA